MTTTASTAPADTKPAPLIPPSLQPFFNETPVLWYEDDDSYGVLVGEVLSELDPHDKIAFLLCKDVADYLWEIERIKRLRREAIHAEIPAALWGIISGLYFHRNKDDSGLQIANDFLPAFKTRLRRMLLVTPEARQEFAEFLEEYDVEPSILHYATFTRASAALATLDATRERAERRRDQLLQGFASRRHSLAAQARSLIARREASDADAEIINPGVTN